LGGSYADLLGILIQTGLKRAVIVPS
jgi:hypothetical protein